MKPLSALFFVFLIAAWAIPLAAEVPRVLNYQGRVLVGSTNFEGVGQFKFALLGLRPNSGRQALAHAQVFATGGVIFNVVIDDGGAGYVAPPKVSFHHQTGQGARVEAIVSAGAVVAFNYLNLGSNYDSSVTVTIDPPPAFQEDTCWSNDGTSVSGREPLQSVSLNVSRGIYSVLLGDTTLSNMTAIAPAVLTNANTILRLWFNNGSAGFQSLAPDQRLGATAFALVAANVAEGAVTAAQLAPGAVTASAVGPNAVASLQIVDGSITDADMSATANIDAAKIGRGDLQATRLRVGTNHTLTGGATLATIAGGKENTITGSYGTVAGGFHNSVSNSYATVSGGNNNTASALYATVSGGHLNKATGPYAAIGGGHLNAATDYATVPGGYENTAGGAYSLAAGRRATAAHAGSFVWADSTGAAIASTGTNQFIVRASGGIWLGTNSSPAITPGHFLDTSTGGYLSAGGAWTDNSDRNAKENFTPAKPREVLAQVDQLPIGTWNYRNEGGEVRHLGPVAQDFHRAFGLGPDEMHLAALDSAGVALAAIQGLHAVVKEKDARIVALERTVAALAERLNQVQASLDAARIRTDGNAATSGHPQAGVP